jgi:hypothetical protein
MIRSFTRVLSRRRENATLKFEVTQCDGYQLIEEE